jgi:hypothetical protein
VSLSIGRLTLDDPEGWSEAAGEEPSVVGGMPVPGSRSGLKASVDLTTFTSSGDTADDRLRARRQLRGMLNNLPYRIRGVYLAWSEDAEQNGWYVPGAGTLQLADVGALSSAYFRMGGLGLTLMGRRRTHRRGVVVYLRDRRKDTTPRDYLGRIYADDFSTLSALDLTWLPAGVSDIVVAGTDPLQVVGSRASIDGGTLTALKSATAGATASFEQDEDDRNVADVVIRDRQGTTTAPADGANDAWEEVYGPDHPLTSDDVPVLENGLCRVRYDSSNPPGFVVDLYDGTEWTEQGKLIVERLGDSDAYLDTLVSAAVMEWSPDRAVIRAVMRVADDANSREDLYLTLQRGWMGPRLEVYPAPQSDGTDAGAKLQWSVADADTDDSALMLIASDASSSKQTAGSGSSSFTAADLSTFGGENWLALLRGGSDAFTVVMSVLQADAQARVEAETEAYGATRNGISVSASETGYASVKMGFHAQEDDQIMEAEDMTLGSGTSTGSDASASGGSRTTTTRTSDATHVSKATWPGSAKGKYRVFARVKTSAATASVYAKNTTGKGKLNGADRTATTTSSTYVWLDLGVITADGSTLEIHAWASATATVSVDRIEAIKLEDRTATTPLYDGARDLGQEHLTDSRSQQTVVAR